MKELAKYEAMYVYNFEGRKYDEDLIEKIKSATLNEVASWKEE